MSRQAILGHLNCGLAPSDADLQFRIRPPLEVCDEYGMDAGQVIVFKSRIAIGTNTLQIERADRVCLQASLAKPQAMRTAAAASLTTATKRDWMKFVHATPSRYASKNQFVRNFL